MDNGLTIRHLAHVLNQLFGLLFAQAQINKKAMNMESKTFQVPNMTCNGCVNTVRTEIEELAGIVNVEVNKPAQLVTVEWDTPALWDGIKSALTEIEYPPVETE